MVQLKHVHEGPRKDSRLQIRVDADAYHLLERAAQYRKGSLSRFVREASLTEARKTIQEHESISLSSQDWDFFLDALSNPGKPNAALKKAYKSYKDTFEK